MWCRSPFSVKRLFSPRNTPFSPLCASLLNCFVFVWGVKEDPYRSASNRTYRFVQLSFSPSFSHPFHFRTSFFRMHSSSKHTRHPVLQSTPFPYSHPIIRGLHNLKTYSRNYFSSPILHLPTPNSHPNFRSSCLRSLTG